MSSLLHHLPSNNCQWMREGRIWKSLLYVPGLSQLFDSWYMFKTVHQHTSFCIVGIFLIFVSRWEYSRIVFMDSPSYSSVASSMVWKDASLHASGLFHWKMTNNEMGPKAFGESCWEKPYEKSLFHAHPGSPSGNAFEKIILPHWPKYSVCITEDMCWRSSR